MSDRALAVTLMRHFREFGYNAEFDPIDHDVCIWIDRGRRFYNPVWLHIKECSIFIYTPSERANVDLADPEMVTKLESEVKRLLNEP